MNLPRLRRMPAAPGGASVPARRVFNRRCMLLNADLIGRKKAQESPKNFSPPLDSLNSGWKGGTLAARFFRRLSPGAAGIPPFRFMETAGVRWLPGPLSHRLLRLLLLCPPLAHAATSPLDCQSGIPGHDSIRRQDSASADLGGREDEPIRRVVVNRRQDFSRMRDFHRDRFAPDLMLHQRGPEPGVQRHVGLQRNLSFSNQSMRLGDRDGRDVERVASVCDSLLRRRREPALIGGQPKKRAGVQNVEHEVAGLGIRATGRPSPFRQFAPLLGRQRLEQRLVIENGQPAFHFRTLSQPRTVGRHRNEFDGRLPAAGRDDHLLAGHRFRHHPGQVCLSFFQSDCHAASLAGSNPNATSRFWMGNGKPGAFANRVAKEGIRNA